MKNLILHPGQRMTREELLYQVSRGENPLCPVCGNGLGTEEGCLTCEYAYRNMLNETQYRLVTVNNGP